MSKIGYFIGGSIMHHHDAAYLGPKDDPREELVQSAIGSISTDVMVTVAGVKMHLAAWMDPEHWEDDWREVGVEDVDSLLAGEVTS